MTLPRRVLAETAIRRERFECRSLYLRVRGTSFSKILTLSCTVKLELLNTWSAGFVPGVHKMSQEGTGVSVLTPR